MREDGALVAGCVLRRERGGSTGDAPLGHDRAVFSLQAPLGGAWILCDVAYDRLAAWVKRGLLRGNASWLAVHRAAPQLTKHSRRDS